MGFDCTAVTGFFEGGEERRGIWCCAWIPTDGSRAGFELGRDAADTRHGLERFGDMANAVVAGHAGYGEVGDRGAGITVGMGMLVRRLGRGDRTVHERRVT